MADVCGGVICGIHRHVIALERFALTPVPSSPRKLRPAELLLELLDGRLVLPSTRLCSTFSQLPHGSCSHYLVNHVSTLRCVAHMPRCCFACVVHLRNAPSSGARLLRGIRRLHELEEMEFLTRPGSKVFKLFLASYSVLCSARGSCPI